MDPHPRISACALQTLGLDHSGGGWAVGVSHGLQAEQHPWPPLTQMPAAPPAVTTQSAPDSVVNFSPEPSGQPREAQGCPHSALYTGLCMCAQHRHFACEDFQTYFNSYIIFYSVHVSQFSSLFLIPDNLVVLGNFFFPTRFP